MPIPTLPANMLPVVNGYSVSDPGGVMRTQVAGGFSRVALDWDRGSQLYAVNMFMDDTSFSAWIAFYHWIIKKGSIPFYMELDSHGVVEPHLVQIIPSTYNVVKVETDAYTVSFSVEAENKVYEMTAVDAGAVVDFYNIYTIDSEEFLNRLRQLARYDLEILP